MNKTNSKRHITICLKRHFVHTIILNKTFSQTILQYKVTSIHIDICNLFTPHVRVICTCESHTLVMGPIELKLSKIRLLHVIEKLRNIVIETQAHRLLHLHRPSFMTDQVGHGWNGGYSFHRELRMYFCKIHGLWRHSDWMSELVTQFTTIPVWFCRNEILSDFQHNLSFVYTARFKTCFGLYGLVHY